MDIVEHAVSSCLIVLCNAPRMSNAFVSPACLSCTLRTFHACATLMHVVVRHLNGVPPHAVGVCSPVRGYEVEYETAVAHGRTPVLEIVQPCAGSSHAEMDSSAAATGLNCVKP